MEILSNKIDVNFKYDALNRDFDFYAITFDNPKGRYGELVNLIYDKAKPLSLIKAKSSRCYYIAVLKGFALGISGCDIAIRKIDLSELSKTEKCKLVIGILPSLISEDDANRDVKAFEKAALYYWVGMRPLSGMSLLEAVEIVIGEHIGQPIINLKVATFTPLKYWAKPDGSFEHKILKKTKFNFDDKHWLFLKNTKGDYIQKAVSKRTVVDAVSVNTKSRSEFLNSKLGVLAYFMSDIKCYMKQYISLKLLPLEGDFRVKYTQGDVEGHYKLIKSELLKDVFNIVNLSDDDISGLVEYLTGEGYTVHQSDAVSNTKLNFVVHYDAEHYSEQAIEDPYKNLHEAADCVVQSIYPDSLYANGELSKAVVESCLKELLIKKEVLSNTLILTKVPGSWTFFYIEKADSSEVANGSDDENIYHRLNCDGGTLSYSRVDETDTDEYFLNLPDLPKAGDHVCFNNETGNGFIIRDTDLFAIAEFEKINVILKEIESGWYSGLKSAWIKEYMNVLKSGSRRVANSQMVLDKLGSFLDEHPDQSNFKRPELSKGATKIEYKHSMQDFFDWIFEVYKVRLAASMKSQNAGYIEAHLGLFFNAKDKLYFVGDKTNASAFSRFCAFRQIICYEGIEVPSALFDMLNVFHVKHKFATVRPFPFKHLREYAKK